MNKPKSRKRDKWDKKAEDFINDNPWDGERKTIATFLLVRSTYRKGHKDGWNAKLRQQLDMGY